MEEDPEGVDSEVQSTFLTIKQLMQRRFKITLKSDCDGPVIVE